MSGLGGFEVITNTAGKKYLGSRGQPEPPNYNQRCQMASLSGKHQSSFPVANFHIRARCFLQAPQAAIGKCKHHIACLTWVVPEPPAKELCSVMLQRAQ